MPTIFLVTIGLAFIYAGYRLFCGLPAMKTRQPVDRTTVFLLNVVPGAFLALLGMAILSAEARTILAARPAVHHMRSPNEGTSWHGAAPKPFERAG